MERSIPLSGRGMLTLCAVPLLAVLGSAHAAGIGVNACIGTGKPDLADGRYDCRNTDLEPGSVEVGQHLFIDWQARDGDEITRIEVDFNASVNADLQGRSPFMLDNYDGANMYWLDTRNNTVEARFSSFGDAVDNFYLALDINRRGTPVQGTPVDPDLDGTTIAIETRYGRQFSCTFRHVDLTTAYAGDPLPLGRVIRLRWMLPCQEMPIFEVEPELIERFSGLVLQFEADWCEENPDSALCGGREGKK